MGALARQVLTVSARNPTSFRSILFARTDGFAFSSPVGRLVTDQLLLGDSGMRVSRVRSTGHWIRLTEHRYASFLFPRAGSLTVRIAGTDTRVPAGEAVLVRPASRLTRVEGTGRHGFEGHVLMMPMDDLLALAARGDATDAIARDVVRATGPGAWRLTSYIARILSEADSAAARPVPARTLDAMAALVQDLLVTWLGDASGATRTAASPSDIARARQAEDIMQSRFDEPLSVATLAEELAISVRSLQLAFQAVFGECPRSRLTRVRLERAHEKLRFADPDEQVTRIALDCGFTHLGRFAEAYRRVYRERPSETLAKWQHQGSVWCNTRTAPQG